MAKVKSRSEEEAAVPHATPPAGSKGLLPTPLIAAFAIVLLAGFALGFTRNARLHDTLFDDLDKSEAQTLPETNGASDAFGIVKIGSRQSGITDYLSLCEQEPPVARKIFRQALEKTGKSARLVALCSSFYLAGSGSLEPQDIDTIAALLDPEKEKDAEVRRTAQRSLADLIFISDTMANQSKWHEVPSGLIVTREEKLRPSDKTGLGIRWSNPDLAHAWWNANKSRGKWDSSLQRFVIEGVAKAEPAPKKAD
jgi:hypothetical protein